MEFALHLGIKRAKETDPTLCRGENYGHSDGTWSLLQTACPTKPPPTYPLIATGGSHNDIMLSLLTQSSGEVQPRQTESLKRRWTLVGLPTEEL